MQLPFFIRKTSKKKSPTRMLSGDVFFDNQKSVLSLRKKARFLVINWKLIFQQKETKLIMFMLGMIILFSGALFSFKSSANVTTFAPESCLGGWYATENATGLPSLLPDSEPIEYNEDNSARLRGNSEIYCGDFRGEIPQDSSPKKFLVTFHVAIDDGTLEHKKSELVETGDVEITNSDNEVGTENIDAVLESSDTPIQIIEDSTVSSEENSTESAGSENVTESTSGSSESTSSEDGSSSGQESSSDSGGETTSTDSAFLRFFIKKVFAQEEVPAPEAQVVEVVSETENTETVSDPEVTIDEPVLEETTDSGDDVVKEESDNIENKEELSLDENSVSTESEESSVPPDAVLEAFYTFDGENWESFGYIRMNTWEESSFEIPLYKWDDLARVQIKLQPVFSFDMKPEVYLDAITVDVEYSDQNADPLRQPDFATDVILSDTTVDDIRVIKMLRDGEPMIWYTKIPPPPTVIEGSPEIEILQGEVTESTETENTDNTVQTETPSENVQQNPTNNTETTPPEVLEEVTPVQETQARIINTIKSTFGLERVWAQESSLGESSSGGGESSGGETSSASSSDSSGSESSSSSSESTSEQSSSGQESGSSVQSQTTQTEEVSSNENISIEQQDFTLEEAGIPVQEIINVDDVLNNKIPDILDINETIIPITTTEEIVPGVTPIIYTEEQIQQERAKGLEWNFVAKGDVVDITTPVDISGGKIFWLSRDKTAIYEYNTLSGSVSSQSINPEKEVEIKYTEPNGDISEINIDPVDLLITTPKEEETGIQDPTVPEVKTEEAIVPTVVSSKEEDGSLESVKEIVQ